MALSDQQPPPQSSEFSETPRPKKRRRTAKACNQCRKQKARCEHRHDDPNQADRWEDPCHRCGVLGLECSLVEDKRRERRELMESLKRSGDLEENDNGGTQHQGEGVGGGEMGITNENILDFQVPDFTTPLPVTSSFMSIPPLLPSSSNSTGNGFGEATPVGPAQYPIASQNFQPYGPSSSSLDWGSGGVGDANPNHGSGGGGRGETINERTNPHRSASLGEGKSPESGNETSQSSRSHSEIHEDLKELMPIHLSYQAHIRSKTHTPSSGVGSPFDNFGSSDPGMQYPVIHPHPSSSKMETTSQAHSFSSSLPVPASSSNSQADPQQFLRPEFTTHSELTTLSKNRSKNLHDENNNGPYESESFKWRSPSQLLTKLLIKCENIPQEGPGWDSNDMSGPRIMNGAETHEGSNIASRKRTRDGENQNNNSAGHSGDDESEGEEGEQWSWSHAHQIGDQEIFGKRGDPGWMEYEIFDKKSLRNLRKIFNDQYSPWIGFLIPINKLGSQSFLGAVCLYLASRHCSPSKPGSVSGPHNDRSSHNPIPPFTISPTLIASLHHRITSQLTRVIFSSTQTISTIWGLSLLARWIPVDLLNFEGRGTDGEAMWDESNLMETAISMAKKMGMDLNDSKGRLYNKLLLENQPESWKREDLEEAKLWFSLCIQSAFPSMLKNHIVRDKELSISFPKSLNLVETILGPPTASTSTAGSGSDHSSTPTPARTGLIFCARVIRMFEDVGKIQPPVVDEQASFDRFVNDHLKMVKQVDEELKSFGRISAVSRSSDSPYFTAFKMLGHFCKGYFFAQGMMMLNAVAHEELSSSRHRDPIWKKGLHNPFHSAVASLAMPMGMEFEEVVMIAVSTAFPEKAFSSAPDFILNMIAYSACGLVKWHVTTLELENKDRPDARERFNLQVKLAEKMKAAALSKHDLNWRYSRVMMVITKVWQERAREVALSHECSDKCPSWARGASHHLDHISSQTPHPTNNNNSGAVNSAQNYHHPPDTVQFNNIAEGDVPSLELLQAMASQTGIPSSSATATNIPPGNPGNLGNPEVTQSSSSSSPIKGFESGTTSSNDFNNFDFNWGNSNFLTDDFQTLLFGRDPFGFDIFESFTGSSSDHPHQQPPEWNPNTSYGN